MKPGRDAISQAVEGSRGNLSRVAEVLGVSWDTARKWVFDDPGLKSLFESERDKVLDKAEDIIYTALDQNDIPTAKWVLSTLGRYRGWNEKVRLEDRHRDPFAIF